MADPPRRGDGGGVGAERSRSLPPPPPPPRDLRGSSSSSVGGSGGGGGLHNNNVVRLRVLSAVTGSVHVLELNVDDDELSTVQMRKRLSPFVPFNDQILLLGGPPYRVLRDSYLRSLDVLTALKRGDEEDSSQDSYYYGADAKEEEGVTADDDDGGGEQHQRQQVEEEQEGEAGGGRAVAASDADATEEERSSTVPAIEAAASAASEEAGGDTTDRLRGRAAPADPSRSTRAQRGPFRHRRPRRRPGGGTGSPSTSKRLFLFSKRSLSETSTDHYPTPIVLEPNGPVPPPPLPPVEARRGVAPHDSALHVSPSSSLTFGSKAAAAASSSEVATSPSPLHQALSAYEHQSYVRLRAARHYADLTDVRYVSCVSCLQEQYVLRLALEAATSNWHDHRSNAARVRGEFEREFRRVVGGDAGDGIGGGGGAVGQGGDGLPAGTGGEVGAQRESGGGAGGGTVLDRFEEHLTRLGAIRLHPALVAKAADAASAAASALAVSSSTTTASMAAAGASAASSTVGASASASGMTRGGGTGAAALSQHQHQHHHSSSPKMETLLDAVPVERERAWANRCRSSRKRLVELRDELNAAFVDALGAERQRPSTSSALVEGSGSGVGYGYDPRDDTMRDDTLAEEAVEALRDEVEQIASEVRARQGRRLAALTEHHRDAVRIVLRAVSSSSSSASSSGVQQSGGASGDVKEEGGGEEEGGVVGAEGGGAADDETGAAASSASATAPRDAFAALEELSRSSSDAIPAMERDDALLVDLQGRVASYKTESLRRIRARLRLISESQSSIQRALSGVAVLRDALSQYANDASHLDHVSNLPDSYAAFLTEVRRRKAYGEAVAAAAAAIAERMAVLRSDEVKAREAFLRGPGRHLTPVFFDVFVPSLASPPPPLFVPPRFPDAAVEGDALPDVGAAEEEEEEGERHGAADERGSGRTAGVDARGGMGKAEEASGSHDASAAAAVGDDENDTPASAPASSDGGEDDGDDDPRGLIVSADGNGIVADGSSDDPHGAAAGRAEADAERKALAYENAALRQALERMGGRAPRTYVEEHREADRKRAAEDDARRKTLVRRVQEEEGRTAALRSEMDALRSKLEVARAEASAAAATAAASAVDRSGGVVDGDGHHPSDDDDRISHSSFAVGDVGLFMPTGRGSAGKRIYLAFHSGCPHRYLSMDCIEGTPDYVLGRIVFQEELVAAGSAGSDSNPYGLKPGTKFWVLTVEVLRVP